MQPGDRVRVFIQGQWRKGKYTGLEPGADRNYHDMAHLVLFDDWPNIARAVSAGEMVRECKCDDCQTGRPNDN